MLTLRQLQYFLALADLRHFGKAAERCCVTQPALSMQIKELEDTLGIQLVRRQRGHIALTEDGKEVAARAQILLSAARDLQDYARHQNRTLFGELRLGVIPSVAPYLLPKVLPKLDAVYPELRLQLQETLTESLIADVVESSLDAIIVALPVDDERLETIRLFDDAFLLARCRNAGRRKVRSVSAASLKHERMLLLNDGHCLRDQALEYCQTIDPVALSEFGASSLSTIMKMVASGYGVTLLPEIAADTELADPRIELLRFVEPEPKRTIGLAWLKSSARSKDFAALARLIIEAHGTTPTDTDDDARPIARLAS